MVEPKHYPGLNEIQVNESRALHGVNILTPPEKESLLTRFLEKFRDPLIIILLVAGALSIGISIYEYYGLHEGAAVFFEPLGIFVAILLATGLAFFFEIKADREFAILNQVNDDEPVQVIRNGNAIQIPKKDVVVGDIVILSTGEEIPADGQLLEAVSLQVDESSLTGEPVCAKSTDPAHFDKEATFPSDHVLRGTKIMEGHGIMTVTAVGDKTENGKVFEAAQIDDSVKTPLNEQLERLGRLISRASYGIAGLIVCVRMAMFFINVGDGFDWMTFLSFFLQTIMIAVTLIVVAVPEGLPMAVTLSLAYSMRRMLKTNNLVRKMHACETMGAITVICTDKTGTLTQNRMQVYETDFGPHKGGSADGGGMQEIINTGIAVNSTAFLDVDSSGVVHTIGNPTEAALLLWLRGQGQDYEKLRESVETVSQLTFSTERKYMGTLIKDGGGKYLLFIKGAPEIVLSKCSLAAMPEGDVPVADIEADVRATLSRYQDMAMRTLGFAYAETDPADAETPVEKLAERGLVFLGVAAISDPVREDVGQAVAECRSAGIAVKIVTGDTPATAREIARQIGLWDDTSDAAENIITGPEFASLTDEEAIARVQALKIMARARPMDKQRLVQLLQKKGEVVAVTGDGTNDAPALNFADVGLSMGTGTSVAKEASDITIIDDSFASIATAVMWGRSLYKNIQRFIVFQLTINLVALLIVFLGSAFGTEMPLSVTQMLWVNLIMDTLAAGALASLPPDRRVMDDAPRDASAFIITPSMKRSIFVTGILSAAGLLGVLWWFYHTQGGVSRAELSMFFTLFVMMQVWNLMNVKAFASGRSAFAGMGQSLTFVLVLLAIVAGQVLIVTYGGDVFRTEALSMEQWIWVLGGSSVVLWTGEAVRLFTGKKTVKKYKA